MKNNRILNSLGNVDDKYIEESALPQKSGKSKNRFFWIKFGSIAAGLIILIAAAYGITTIRFGASKSNATASDKYVNMSPEINGSDFNNSGYYDSAENISDSNSAAESVQEGRPGSSSQDSNGAGTNESQKNDIAEEYGGSQKLIKTVELTMETKEFDKCIQTINQTVSELGGYTENMEVRGRADSNSRYASAVLRIPSDKIDTVQNAFEDIATITYSTESKKDVTLNYSDVESRLKALRTEQDTLLKLLENAQALSDTIAIQSQLTQVRYQIESYESRLRLLQNKISYSTININVREVYRESIVNPSFSESIRNKFADSIDNIISSSTDFAIWFIGSIPYFVIIGVIIAIIAAIVTIIRKRRRKRNL